MKKNIRRILILFAFAILCVLFSHGKVYGKQADVPIIDNHGYPVIARWHYDNSVGGVNTQTILDDLKNAFGYNQEHLYSYMKFETTMTVIHTGVAGGYDVEFATDEINKGGYSSIVSWNGKDETDVDLDSLQTKYCLEMNFDKLRDLPIGEKVEYPVVIVCGLYMNDKGVQFGRDEWNKGFDFTGELDCYFELRIDMLWNDFDEVYFEEENRNLEYGRNINLEDLYGIEIYEMDYSRDQVTSIEEAYFSPLSKLLDFVEYPVESTLDICIWVLRSIGDLFQWLANLWQTTINGTAGHLSVTYTYSDLYKQGPNGSSNKYTNVGNYIENGTATGSKVKGINVGISAEPNDDTKEGENLNYNFTKEESRIPVIAVDLYTIATNKNNLFDVNFLVPSPIHSDNSIWMLIRNFIASIIYAMLYFTSACLLVTLIWHGIKIVIGSFSDPLQRMKHIKGLEKFAISLSILIGIVVIEAICIYASYMFLEDTGARTNTYELPIRVNVQGTYSFSTTPTGYFRYMSTIQNLNLIGEKALNASIYVVLAAINLVLTIIMFVRTIVMWLLTVQGYTIVIQNLFSDENNIKAKFTSWVVQYIKWSSIQIILAIASKIIFDSIIS